jgi:hypothetical protein
MESATAKAQAEERLRPFVGVDLSTEVLNDIENTVNELIMEWAKLRFFLHDGKGNLIKGIKLWYDLFNGQLRFAFRYPTTQINIAGRF